jgi:Flp pilus assembly pilin Flp
MSIENLGPEEVLVEEKNEEGATMVEYALLVALMAIALMAAVTFMKEGASTRFSQVNSALTE